LKTSSAQPSHTRTHRAETPARRTLSLIPLARAAPTVALEAAAEPDALAEVATVKKVKKVEEEAVELEEVEEEAVELEEVKEKGTDAESNLEKKQSTLMNTASPKRTVLLITGLTVATAIIVFLTVQYVVNNKSEERQALELHRAGNIDESIPLTERLIARSNNADKTAYLQLLLASDLFLRSEDSDRTRTLELYKKVITDPDLSPRVRATAINESIAIYQSSRDEEFARLLLRPDVFPTISEGDDIALAIRKASEAAHGLYPSPFSAYNIALWYGTEFAKNPEATGLGNRRNLKEWTHKGDDLIPQALSANLEKTRLASMHMASGMAHDYFAFAVSEDDDARRLQLRKSEAAYRNALNTLDPVSTFYEYQLSQFIRFQYADMIRHNYGNSRSAHIQRIVGPILDKPSDYAGKVTHFEQFVSSEMQKPESRFKDIFASFVRFVPQFSALWEQTVDER